MRLAPLAALLFGLWLAPGAWAHTPAEEHAARLLARNKETVLEFYRHVFEAQDVRAAGRFLAKDYIQHNPRVPGGLAGFEAFFSAIWKTPRPVEPVLRNPPVIVMAERDLVTVVFLRPRPEPDDPTKTYKSYWFDTYRLDAAGKIVEHWDAATK